MADVSPTPERRFRKKPVVIQATRWTGANIDEVLAFIADGHENFNHLPRSPNDPHVHQGIGHCPPLGTIDIPTLEGTITASAGDWILRGVKGEFYPCKPDIFAMTYEAESIASERTDFLTDACEHLFGCFLSPVQDEEGKHGFQCAICETPVEIESWVHADHDGDCIIPKVREHLAKHRPACVPPKKEA